MEQWRDIPGYEGLYQISIDTKEGRCRSVRRMKLLKNTISKKDKRIYWGLCVNRKEIVQQAARWIAITYPEFVENEYFKGAHIDHKDTNVRNNHPSNLRWVTPADNNRNPLTRKHMSEGKKGKKLSEEHKHNISKGGKGKQINRADLSKRVLRFDSNGICVGDYPSASEASRITKIPRGSISNYLLGRKDKRGFVWKYA